MIGIVDYGLGNVRAFASIYRLLDIPVRILRDAGDMVGLSKIIIPGVGSFDHAMQSLEASGMREGLDEAALRQRLPVLGVCVGLQMLMQSSDEGARPGLGWIPGTSKRFAAQAGGMTLPVPHMGWNDVRGVASDPLFRSIADHSRFYFLHSYYVSCPDSAAALATADYGGEFVCALRRDNIMGVQFHPEKSHRSGIQLLKNFAEFETC